jgi:hypothetical protein
LTISGEVASAYNSAPLPPWLVGRARELWRPLLAIAYVAGAGSGELLRLAGEHVQDRDSVSPEAEALIAILAERIGGVATATVRPGELTTPLQHRLGWSRPPSAEFVGSWLRRLGFKKGRRDRQGAVYEVRAAHVRQLQARLAPPQTDTEEPSHG